MASGPVIGRLLAILYGSSAIIGLAANGIHLAQSGDGDVWRLAGNLLVLALAPLFLRMRRVVPWVVNVATTVGAGLVTLAVLLTQSGPGAASVAILYLLVTLPTFYLYPRSVAWSHSIAVGVLALVTLYAHGSFDAPSVVRGVGVGVALAVVIGWLVRAGDLAERDFTSGLTNRRGFERRAQAFLQGYDGSSRAALVVIDLDGLDSVNERRGSDYGDDLILRLGRAWTAVLPDGALLARHGGDEFTLMVDDISPEGLEAILAKMRAATPELTFTAGVAWCAAGETLTMLMLRADGAIFQAKRRGYGQTVAAVGASTVRSGSDIRDALARGEFVLHYQPVVDLTTGTVDKAEALVRWVQPGGRTVPPDEFIHLAEQTGAMLELGDWVVATACRTAATWPTTVDGRPVAVSVNASGTELQDPSYAGRVLRHVADAGLTPDRLMIELVESNYSLSSRSVRENLMSLTDAGVRLAIDDFGTGYSSLSRLDQLRVDILKIDRSFVRALTGPDQPMPVVTAILAMADALRIEVVAEGIETAEQADWLRSRGCTHGQGYFYSRPVPELGPAELALVGS
ncbi:putative bifunctional diguanylate cyclase/phosphodiesterase [Xylanimonas oleitrophica]|uniref:putative bifunctional diguanylate cyclase/phosphodiesterase n=1 Tax=Xylanimonas oleitrophica TaxID=2607479 RepID=UPI0011B5062E|nr:bifunctional diguanylate cyclase/phosphodiesterase [Xylanimonas oleitrophica]